MQNTYTIIVTYNGMQWIEPCINSVKDDSVVVVVDNNSTDATVSFIESNYPEVIVLTQAKNLGFGAANNLGINKALALGAEHVLLLNQDAKMNQGALLALVDFQQSQPMYGLLSPIHCDWSGHYLEIAFSHYMSYRNNEHFYSDFVLGKEQKDVYDVPMIAAACWLLSKDVLQKVGGFDPIFFHLGEDANFCQRVRYHGFNIGVLPNTIVCHDTKERERGNTPKYSEKYLNMTDYRSKAKYADVNISNITEKLAYRRNQLLKQMITHIVSFNRKSALGAYKEYKQFKAMCPLVLRSRELNKQIGSHYLDIE